MNIHFNEDYQNKYILFERIGIGNFTEVYKGKNINTNEERAIKIIKLKDIKFILKNDYSIEEANNELKDFINKIINEINIMIKCGENNENSVKYYESFENENEFVIIMELCKESLK